MTNTERFLELAESEKTRARVYTKIGDLERAESALRGVIELLGPTLDESEDAPLRSIDDSRVEVARTLADTYGMLGGVERRRGDIDAAREAYEEGRALELNEAYELSDSYNLVNSTVVSLLIGARTPDEARPQVEQALTRVKAQVEGARRNQSWAWADLALLNLLAEDTRAAFSAYDRFLDCKPTISEFRSVRSVLEDLKGSNASSTNYDDVMSAALEYLDKRREGVRS